MFGNINPPPRVKPEPLKRSHVQAIKDATEERSKGNNENASRKDGRRGKSDDNHASLAESSSDDASYSTISSSTTATTQHQQRAESESISADNTKSDTAKRGSLNITA